MIALIIIIFAIAIFAIAAKGGIVSSANPQLDQWNSLCLQNATASQTLLPEEIKAIIAIESSGNPDSQNPNDPSYGLMGVTMYIGREFGGVSTSSDLFDPATNVQAGSGFLDYLKAKYADRFPLNTSDGWVQMYNLGEPRFLAGERVPSYLSKFNSFISQFSGDFSSGVTGSY